MQNLIDPAILFFIFGVLAGTVKSNLEIPPAISRFLSLYLLMALGLKGRLCAVAIGPDGHVGISLAAAVLLAIVIPLIGYAVLRRFVSGFDAAAVAATYGSVSAVTFVTAVQTLENQGVPYGGHMAAAMALMESPAIILAVVLANSLRQKQASGVALQAGGVAALGGPAAPHGASVGKILHESFTDGAQLLLLGAMVIGLITGEAGKEAMAPFSVDLFKGMLAFFLLDMGLMAARNLPQVKGQSPVLIAYAVLGPIVHAALALGLAVALKLSAGDGALLMVLAASASYIAVPAVLRTALPEAKPALYFGLSLGLTFPLNIVLGIPVYLAVAQRSWDDRLNRTHQPTINPQALARDVGRSIRGQKGDGRGHFFAGAVTLHGHALAALLLGGQAVDPARQHIVHAHLVHRVLVGKELGESGQARACHR
jgi:uncharacterized protein